MTYYLVKQGSASTMSTAKKPAVFSFHFQVCFVRLPRQLVSRFPNIIHVKKETKHSRKGSLTVEPTVVLLADRNVNVEQKKFFENNTEINS